MNKIFFLLFLGLLFLTFCCSGKKYTSFKVNDVKVSDSLLKEIPGKKAVENFLGEKIEYTSLKNEKLVDPIRNIPSRLNRFLTTIHLSFAEHRPLVLSPDMFWLLIVQGFAIHVNQDPEKYRKLLVKHQGKATIQIRRDDFIKGSPDNAWDEAVPEITDKIKAYTKDDINALIVQKFSTTSSNDTLAYQITLMDALNNYFTYEVHTLCGIPEIRLNGTPDDWQKLIDQAKALAKYDLNWWIAEIIPYLEKIHESSKGNVDRDFWKSIYKSQSQSGGDAVTGWIIKFFPYLLYSEKSRLPYSRNPNIPKDLNKIDGFEAPKLNVFPSGVSKASFSWIIGVSLETATTFPMEFFAGFLGIKQNAKTKALTPVISWGVKESYKTQFSNIPEKLKPYFIEKNKTTKLSFWDIEINDDDLKQIAKLKKLNVIEIRNSNITDKGLSCISELKELSALGIAGSKITDASASAINKLKKLYRLDVSGSNLTNAWLEKVKLPKLRALNISATKITLDGIKKFKKKYPKVKITINYNSSDTIGHRLKKLYNFDFKDNPELMNYISLLRKDECDSKKSVLCKIAESSDPRKLEVLLTATNDPYKSNESIELIKFFYPSKDILPWLKHSSANLRKAACKTLGTYKNLRNQDALLTMLKDEDDNVKIAAIRALIHLGTPGSKKKLKNMFYADISCKVFYEIMNSCNNINYSKDFIEKKLQKYYKDSNNPEEKAKLLTTIIKLDLKRAEPIILEELNSQNYAFKEAAIKAAGEIKSKKAVPILIKMLDHKIDYQYEYYIIQVLSEIKDKRAIKPVLNYMKGRPRYNHLHFKALYKLTDEAEFINILNSNKKLKKSALIFIMNNADRNFAPLAFKLLEMKDKEYQQAAAAIIYENNEYWKLNWNELKKKYPILEEIEKKNGPPQKEESESVKKKQTFDELIKNLINNNDGDAREKAATELGELGNKKALPYLKKAQKEDYGSVCKEAELAIFKILYADKPDILLAKLKTPKAELNIKKYIIDRLANLKYKPAVKTLSAILNDKLKSGDIESKKLDHKKVFLALLKIDKKKADPFIASYICSNADNDFRAEDDDDVVTKFLVEEYNDNYFKTLLKLLENPKANHKLIGNVFASKKETRAQKALSRFFRSGNSSMFLEIIVNIGGSDTESYAIEALNYSNLWPDAMECIAKHGTAKSIKPLEELLKNLHENDKSRVNKVIRKLKAAKECGGTSSK